MVTQTRLHQDEVIAALQSSKGDLSLYIWDDKEMVWNRMRAEDIDKLKEIVAQLAKRGKNGN